MILAKLEESEHYLLLFGWLYKQESNKVLQLCLNPKDYDDAIIEAYGGFGELHASETQIVQGILIKVFRWPKLTRCGSLCAHLCYIPNQISYCEDYDPMEFKP